jgi:hypothetical protein
MSIEVKSKSLNLNVGVIKKVADVIVSITIPFKGIASCCLARLKANCGNPSSPMNGTEEAALAFALFETVRDKLGGSGLETLSTKSTNISCNSIGGNLCITWHTQGTLTAVRKSTGLALHCMNPTKLYSKYSENVRFLTGKAGNREEFNFVAKKLSKEIKNITITVVGKINVTEEKLKDAIKTLESKLPDIDLPSEKETSAPEKRKSDNDMDYPHIKCHGLAAAVISDYIRNTSNGMNVAITENGVTIYNTGWSSKHKQLSDKKRIHDYVEKKYLKIEKRGELSALFAYFSLSEGYIDSIIAKSILSNKLKTSRIIELIEKNFI